MVLFGVGELLGGFFIGFIVDRFGSKLAAIVNVVIILAMISTTITFLLIDEFSWLAFLMTFLWGFQDSAVVTHTQEMLGFEFDNNSEPFTILNIV